MCLKSSFWQEKKQLIINQILSFKIDLIAQIFDILPRSQFIKVRAYQFSNGLF